MNLPGGAVGEQTGDHTVVDPKHYIQRSIVWYQKNQSHGISGLNTVGKAVGQVSSPRKQSTKLFGQAR